MRTGGFPGNEWLKNELLKEQEFGYGYLEEFGQNKVQDRARLLHLQAGRGIIYRPPTY